MRATTGDRTAADRMHRVGIALVVTFWAMHYLLLSGARAIQYAETDPAMLFPRLLVVAAAIAISLCILQVHTRVSANGLAGRLLLTIALAVVGCALHFSANYIVFHFFGPRLDAPDGKKYSMELIGYALAVVDWFWSYLSLSAMLMTLRYHADMVDRDLRLARLETLARSAQLRALRYQLNPHFLFNSLNSIAALVRRDDRRPAEEMVENLSDFLRAGLAIDPGEEIALDREIALQRLYLDVEAVRFPQRLRVEIDVPSELTEARVPSLILQPPIENAIKYAVAGSQGPVTLRIAAWRVRNRLCLEIRDDGGDNPRGATPSGTGVGLANVADRLRALFGDDHYFSAGPDPVRGFAVKIELPLRFGKVRDAAA